MADAKVKKTAVKKAAPVKKKEAKKVNYAEMKLAELRTTLAARQQDLLDSQRSHRGGELVNPRVLTATRKDIARILTAINAQNEAA